MTTGAVRVSEGHCQYSICSAGTIAITTTGTARATAVISRCRSGRSSSGSASAPLVAGASSVRAGANGGPDDGRTKPGPEVSFTAMAPSTGAYRLFLDFRHEGKVRTAAFTVHAGRAAARADR